MLANYFFVYLPLGFLSNFVFVVNRVKDKWYVVVFGVAGGGVGWLIPEAIAVKDVGVVMADVMGESLEARVANERGAGMMEALDVRWVV